MARPDLDSATAREADMVLRLRAALRSPHRRLVLLLAVLVLGGVVASHHTEPMGMDGMAGGICLAVLGGGAALLVSRPRPRCLPRLRPLRFRRPRRLPWIAPPLSAPARAGPLYLRLSVLRT